jgi:hypothetical protein
MFAPFDVVLINQDIPADGLKMGMVGTVVDVYTQPTIAYEVEFCDAMGRTIAQTALSSDQLRYATNAEIRTYRAQH